MNVKAFLISNLLLLVLVLAVRKSHAQSEYKFIHYDEDYGIDTKVNAISQDSLGYIWLATEKGMMQFDGYSFNKGIDSMLHDIPVLGFVFPDNFNYWISTSKHGLIHYNLLKDSIRIYSHDEKDPHSLQNNYVGELFLSKSGRIICGNWWGISEYLPAKDHFRNIRLPDAEASNASVISIHEDQQSNFWIGTWGGFLYKTDGDFKILETYSPKPDSDYYLDKGRISDIGEDADGNIWIATWDGGFCKLNQTKHTFECLNTDENVFNSRVGNNRIHSFTFKDNLFYIASEDGMLIFDPQDQNLQSITYNDLNRNSISSPIINCVYFDDQNGMWLGTPYSGLNYYSPYLSRFMNFSRLLQPDSKLPSSQIEGAFEVSGDEVWLGTMKGSVIFNPTNYTFSTFKEKAINFPSDAHIHVGIKDESNYYVGTNKGIIRYNPQVNRYDEFPISSFNFTNVTIHDMYFGPDSSKIFFSIGGRGAFYFDLITNTYFILSDSEFSSLKPINNNYLLLDGVKSFEIFDIEKLQSHKNFSTRQEDGKFTSFINKVKEIIVENDSILGVCTNEYIYRFNWVTEKIIDSLHFNTTGIDFNLRFLYQFDNSNYWMTTNRGLFHFDSGLNNSQLFNESDGLIKSNLNQAKLKRLESGNILITTSEGLTLFSPDMFNLDSAVVSLRITTLKINNEVQKYSESTYLKSPLFKISELTLPRKKNNLEFEVSLLNYSLSDKNQYRYKLSGLSDNWSKPQKSNAIRFQNLPHGKYLLEIEGANHDGVWINKTQPIVIHIKPPYYLSWWFILSGILFFAFVIMVLIKNRERKLKNDKSVLQDKISEAQGEIVKQKEEILMQKQELKLRAAEERDMRWLNEGLAKFTDITSKNKSNLKELTQRFLSNLVQFIEADQGGLFLLNDEDKNNPFLELTASYAYSKEKLEQTRIEIGEGQVGTCYKERRHIEINNLPDGYTKITSGLGEKSPKSLILFPLKMDEIVLGVIELASLKKIKGIKVVFLEKICANITSILATEQANQRAMKMYNDSINQAEELKMKEEELRQNLEEMQATQEELHRKNLEVQKNMQELQKAKLESEEREQDLIEMAEQQAAAEEELRLKIKKLEEENVLLKDELENLQA